MQRNRTSQRVFNDVLNKYKAILPATSITEGLFNLLCSKQQFWVRLEVKEGNEIDAFPFPPKIRNRTQRRSAPIVLFVHGSVESAVFFHELKEYADDFYLMETVLPEAALTLVLFYV